MRLCMPTITFSRAVMLANSRMFWNVRPMPSATISLGRELRKMPNRASIRTYQRGRMMATSRAGMIANMVSTTSPLPT